MIKGNLVVLQFTSNSSYCEVVKAGQVKADDFNIDLIEGTWSYKEWKNIPIGQARSSCGQVGGPAIKYGVIGVYNRSTEHLNSMAHDAVEAVKWGSPPSALGGYVQY